MMNDPENTAAERPVSKRLDYHEVRLQRLEQALHALAQHAQRSEMRVVGVVALSLVTWSLVAAAVWWVIR